MEGNDYGMAQRAKGSANGDEPRAARHPSGQSCVCLLFAFFLCRILSLAPGFVSSHILSNTHTCYENRIDSGFGAENGIKSTVTRGRAQGDIFGVFSISGSQNSARFLHGYGA